MKKIMIGIGMILLLLVIYFVAQNFVGLVLGIIHAVGISISAIQSGAELDIPQVTEDLIQFITKQSSWIVLLAVAITAPSYFLLYRNRRRELNTFISLRGIGAVSIPVLVIFGLSLNFVLEMVLGLLSQLDFLSGIFDRYNQLASTIVSGSFVLSLIAVGIIGPIFEEILFRGLIFGELRKITKVRLAIVIQAFLFGAFHMNIVQGSYAFLIGIFLGYIYYRSNSILAPTVIHITINSSTVLLPMLFTDAQWEAWGGAVVAASLILLIAACVFILTSRRFRHSMDDGLYYASRTPVLEPPTDAGQQNG